MDARPLIFSDAKSSPALSRAAKRGDVRRIARGIFTRDLLSPPAEIVRRSAFEVVGHLCPGAVISDRSALTAQPDAAGNLYVVHPRQRPLALPGLTIIPRAGHGPLADDAPLPYGVWIASRARAWLENLVSSRAVKGRPARTLNRRELHDWIARTARVEGEEKLNAIRDRAREIAPELELTREFEELDKIIGAAIGTQQVETDSEPLRAAQRGERFAERRDEAFAILAAHLAARAPAPRPALASDAGRRALFPFFEAYFSNFIEGTEFTVDEAAEIVFDGRVPPNRPADAHDILGTFRLVSDEAEMRRVPRDLNELTTLLKQRHARILEGRPEKRPGEFKTRANRAGATEFVAPEYVIGTLARGLHHLRGLEDPFARAVMVMFIVSEVHPFDDGNGRTARVMMNAELAAGGETRILIPTAFRNEYLSGLRAMTHNREPGPLTRVLDFAQRYSAQLDLSTRESARRVLEATNAFVDSTEAERSGRRLTLPSELPR